MPRRSVVACSTSKRLEFPGRSQKNLAHRPGTTCGSAHDACAPGVAITTWRERTVEQTLPRRTEVGHPGICQMHLPPPLLLWRHPRQGGRLQYTYPKRGCHTHRMCPYARVHADAVRDAPVGSPVHLRLPLPLAAAKDRRAPLTPCPALPCPSLPSLHAPLPALSDIVTPGRRCDLQPPHGSPRRSRPRARGPEAGLGPHAGVLPRAWFASICSPASPSAGTDGVLDGAVAASAPRARRVLLSSREALKPECGSIFLIAARLRQFMRDWLVRSRSCMEGGESCDRHPGRWESRPSRQMKISAVREPTTSVAELWR